MNTTNLLSFYRCGVLIIITSYILKHRKKFKNSFNKSLNIFLDMKKNNFTYWVLSLALLFNVSAFAQYDDVYYNPDTDGDYYETNDYDEDTYTDEEDSSSDADEYAYDDDSFDDFNRRNDRFDNDGYYYSSRIRRFNRPYYGFNYYDPVYVDSYYYGNGYNRPFNNYGSTVLIYSNNNSYRNWRRANRYNNWNRYRPYRRSYFSNPWSSPYGYGYATGNRANFFNGYGGYNSPYNNNFGGAYGSNAYCPPSYGNGLNYNTRTNNYTNTNNSTGNYYGSRRSGDVRNVGNTGTLGRGNGSASNSGRGTTRGTSTTSTRGTRGTNTGKNSTYSSRKRSNNNNSYRGKRSTTSKPSTRGSYKSNRRSGTLKGSNSGSSSRGSYKSNRSSSRKTYTKPSRSYRSTPKTSTRSKSSFKGSSKGSSSFKRSRGN